MSETIVPGGGSSASKPSRELKPIWFAAVVGVLAIAGAAFLYLHGGKTKDLTTSGGQVSGVVEGYQSGTTPPNQILVIDYTVNKVDYRARITEGSDSPAYRKSQKVTVYYDTADPTKVEVDGRGNQSKKKPVLPAAVLLVVGLGLVVLPIVRR